ncbi:MAG: hypothetical protein QGG42_14275 [Phycisphaerae bacterium]|jgi:hypothetical protein|nr:hypothetical protein [Phycisphaerae bacterium]
MYRKRGFVAIVAAGMIAGILTSADVVLGVPTVSPAYQKVIAVVKSTELSKDQKIARLEELAGAKDTQMIALYQMELLDPQKTMQVAAGIFKARGSSRLTKLRMGRFMLTRERPGKKGFPRDFIKEFASYLVGAVLDGGQEEFCRKLPGHPMTAVGEYAYLASYFQGYKGVDFAPFKDARLVPILISCLDAPDNTYSAAQHGCVRGKEGESTGRNTARQQIPVALGRLGDGRAVKPLRRVLSDHHDWHERNNAAYALAMLAPAGVRAKLVGEMRSRKVTGANGRFDGAKDRYRHLYAFGRGLLARGDDAGVEFMAFEYSIYDSYDGLSEVAYMLSERLKVLKGVKSSKLEGFFNQAFDNERVTGMLLMDKTKVKVDRGPNAYDFTRAAPRIEGMFDTVCRIIEANGLTSLGTKVRKIARRSASKVIRRRGEQCAAKLQARSAGE